jgi:hypothetical protein
METLTGVDRFMMSGTRATLVLKPDAELAEADVKQALEAKGLKFESLEEVVVERPAAAYVAKTPKFT